MKTGKLSNGELRRLVLDRLPALPGGITSGPGIGLDCAAVNCEKGQVILTTDPITGAAKDIGRLAVHISCNDIAACGIRPSALMLVIIAPADATAEEISMVVDQAADAARELEVSIAGGHTEVSAAVNRFVIVTTALGFAGSGPIIQASGGKPGDSILMTKTAGIEGTAIFAADQKNRLAADLSSQELAEAASLVKQVSVVAEGVIGGQLGVHAMHDATEGGILGACWELAEASGLGCKIEADLIPMHPLTSKICCLLAVDPLRLIASGSLIMATDQPEKLAAALAAKGICGTIIGKLTENGSRVLNLAGKSLELSEPGPDELYKIT